MASPFPGMDPYLEDSSRWASFHNMYLAYMARDLNLALRGRYAVRTTERVVVESMGEPRRRIEPDVAILSRKRRSGRIAVAEYDAPVWVEAPIEEHRVWSLEIHSLQRRRLVTVIEMLSASNKDGQGADRASYLRKQREVLASDVNLIELDLLRGGDWTLAVPRSRARAAGACDYRVSVSRARDRSGFEVYPIRLSDRLPRIGVPLAGADPDGVVNLQSLLQRCYDEGQYEDEIDYRVPPVPPLSPAQAAWARRILRARK